MYCLFRWKILLSIHVKFIICIDPFKKIQNNLKFMRGNKRLIGWKFKLMNIIFYKKNS